MQQEQIDLNLIRKRFGTEEACVAHLFRLRWPDGFICPRCGHRKYSFHTTRRLFQCSSCHHQASLTAGTVFEKTRIPLPKWFAAIFVVSSGQEDIPILRLQSMLDIKSYKHIWAMVRKIRRALDNRDDQSEVTGLRGFDRSVSACLSTGPITFAELKA